jgi:hypothetical protein
MLPSLLAARSSSSFTLTRLSLLGISFAFSPRSVHTSATVLDYITYDHLSLNTTGGGDFLLGHLPQF